MSLFILPICDRLRPIFMSAGKARTGYVTLHYIFMIARVTATSINFFTADD